VGVAHPATSRDAKVEQDEKPLSVEKLLDLERVPFTNLVNGVSGFQVRGTERHLLLVQQGSPKLKNL